MIEIKKHDDPTEKRECVNCDGPKTNDGYWVMLGDTQKLYLCEYCAQALAYNLPRT